MADICELRPQPTPLLDSISSPSDLKKLTQDELPDLAAEIRQEITRVVCRTGGHLASSLGVVELIIALHYVLNSPQDKIIFDVGHQSYAHKILTGRRAAFETLRQEGGLSGFPKKMESPHDAFDTGHSSTSISAALGLACARDLQGDDYTVVAVVGDGALTGGMAMEAMNHAGALKKKLIVVLNDNNMSISPNVGGLSEYMSLMITRPAYVRFRQQIKSSLEQYMPTRGGRIISFLRRLEEAAKIVFTSPSALFEAVGFKYLGPFDGHDTNLIIDAITGARNIDRAVLLHVVTTKGKGYPPAENDPLTFHGVGVTKYADVLEIPNDPIQKPTENFSNIFGRYLVKEAKENKNIVAITAAMSEGTGLANFFTEYPERSFDVGIAEPHAVTLAAGLAAGGQHRPVVAIYSSFLQRAFDQLFHDVALPSLPVTLAVDRAGPVGEDGPTHHGGLDLSYLRILPNFTVMAPADGHDLESMLEMALTLPGPAAIRYPRGAAPPAGLITPSPLELGKGTILREGTDVAILALGPPVACALEAAEKLAQQGISVGVVNLRFIKPLDENLVLQMAEQTGRILTLEEGSLTGGLFGAVNEVLAGMHTLVHGLGMTDEPLAQATQEKQRAQLGLTTDGICAAILDNFNF